MPLINDNGRLIEVPDPPTVSGGPAPGSAPSPRSRGLPVNDNGRLVDSISGAAWVEDETTETVAEPAEPVEEPAHDSPPGAVFYDPETAPTPYQPDPSLASSAVGQQ